MLDLMPMRLIVCLIALSQLTGCYYAQAVRGQLELMSKREPISEVAAGTGDGALRARLALALEVREFASRELGLPDNRSYRSYADLGRPYALWNVVAAGEFSVEPLRWCFPVAGCIAYRGYFAETAAQRYADKLAAKGYDVSVTGVPAYSTLGRFADPLLNTMLAHGDLYTASLIFHELAHQQLYVRGDTAYNEAFATVIEEEGVQRWLQARGEPGRVAAYEQGKARQAEFAHLVRDTRGRLEKIYARDLPDTVMREHKAAAFADMRARYRAMRDERWDGFDGYDGFFDRELNNAHLALISTYHDLVPALRRLLELTGGDMDAFYDAAARLGRHSPDARRAQLEVLLAE